MSVDIDEIKDVAWFVAPLNLELPAKQGFPFSPHGESRCSGLVRPGSIRSDRGFQDLFPRE